MTLVTGWTLLNDYQVVDNLQAVTYQSSRNTGQMTDTIQNVHSRQLTEKEQQASGGAYTGAMLLWQIPTVMLPPNIVPKEADILTDSNGVAWTVLSRAFSAEGSWHDLTCIALAIAFDLKDKIDVQRAAIGYSTTGAVVKTFPPDGGSILYKQLAARVQLLTDEITEERGVRGLKGTHAIYVSRQVLDVTMEDRVSFNGQFFEIRGQHNPERIDELPVLDCELLP